MSLLAPVLRRRATFLLATAAAGLAACADGGSGPAPAPPADIRPVMAIPQLRGEATELVLSTELVAALRTLGAEPAPLGRARLSDAGVATLPISGGSLEYFTPGTVSPFVRGEVRHAGAGLALATGRARAVLDDLRLDLARSVVTGDVSGAGVRIASDAPLLALDGRRLAPLEEDQDGSTVLDGARVTLRPEGARYLAAALRTDPLPDGLPVAAVRITFAGTAQR